MIKSAFSSTYVGVLKRGLLFFNGYLATPALKSEAKTILAAKPSQNTLDL